VFFAAVFFALIVFRHTENIIRLVKGVEPGIND
jgi:glycerol-3-phosphate acyltransferase PlsY